MGITIITDSGSDIKQEIAKKWGIRVLPLTVRFGDEEFLDDVTLTADQMYKRMIETGELPKTSQVPPYLFGLPSWLSGKRSACQCRRHGFNP